MKLRRSSFTMVSLCFVAMLAACTADPVDTRDDEDTPTIEPRRERPTEGQTCVVDNVPVTNGTVRNGWCCGQAACQYTTCAPHTNPAQQIYSCFNCEFYECWRSY